MERELVRGAGQRRLGMEQCDDVSARIEVIAAEHPNVRHRSACPSSPAADQRYE